MHGLLLVLIGATGANALERNEQLLRVLDGPTVGVLVTSTGQRGDVRANVNTPEQCAYKCLTTLVGGKLCRAFSYKATAPTKCEVYPQRFGFGGWNLVANTQYMYYERPVGKREFRNFQSPDASRFVGAAMRWDNSTQQFLPICSYNVDGPTNPRFVQNQNTTDRFCRDMGYQGAWSRYDAGGNRRRLQDFGDDMGGDDFGSGIGAAAAETYKASYVSEAWQNKPCFVYEVPEGTAGTRRRMVAPTWRSVNANERQKIMMKISCVANDDETLGAILRAGQEKTATGFDDYLPRYRNPTAGRLFTTGRVLAPDQHLFGATAEKCALRCASNNLIGTDRQRCHSFNYNAKDKICELVPGYITDPLAKTVKKAVFTDKAEGWQYYQRQMGYGCWITTGGCSGGASAIAGVTKYPATFIEDATRADVSDGPNDREYVCLTRARWWHENFCQETTEVATTSMFGPSGPMKSWNPRAVDDKGVMGPEESDGCVVEIPDGLSNCKPTLGGTGPLRYKKKFRDSLGESDYAADTSDNNCFQRAKDYYGYYSTDRGCAVAEGNVFKATYVPTQTEFPYPTADCECDAAGRKTDPISGLEFCTRDPKESIKMDSQGVPTVIICKRSGSAPLWKYASVMCDDVPGNMCDVPASKRNDDGSIKQECWLTNTRCPGGPKGTDGYDALVGSAPLDGTSFRLQATTRDECLGVKPDNTDSMAKQMFDKCDCQRGGCGVFESLWRPTSEMRAWPNDGRPARALETGSYISGIRLDQPAVKARRLDLREPPCAKPPCDPYMYNFAELILNPIQRGRWQSFLALYGHEPRSAPMCGGTPCRTGWVRGIDIWWHNNEDTELKLELYEGSGTGGKKLATVRRTVAANNYTYPIDPITGKREEPVLWSEYRATKRDEYIAKEVERTGVKPDETYPLFAQFLEAERFKWAREHYVQDKGGWVAFPLKVQLDKDAQYTFDIVGEGSIGMMTTDPYICKGCESDTAWDITFRTWIEGKEPPLAGKFTIFEEGDVFDVRTTFAILACVFIVGVITGSVWKYCRYKDGQRIAAEQEIEARKVGAAERKPSVVMSEDTTYHSRDTVTSGESTNYN